MNELIFKLRWFRSRLNCCFLQCWLNTFGLLQITGLKRYGVLLCPLLFWFLHYVGSSDSIPTLGCWRNATSLQHQSSQSIGPLLRVLFWHVDRFLHRSARDIMWHQHKSHPQPSSWSVTDFVSDRSTALLITLWALYRCLVWCLRTVLLKILLST